MARLVWLVACVITMAGCSQPTAAPAGDVGPAATNDRSNATVEPSRNDTFEATSGGNVSQAPPSVFYLGADATPTPCSSGQDAQAFGTASPGFTYWNHTYAVNGTIERANATIWMEVHEEFVLSTNMGWSYQNNDHGDYRLGGDYWRPATPVVEPGLYRIEQSSEAFGDERERTIQVGESLGIHWNPTNTAVAQAPAYSVLCEPGHMSQMWIEYA